MEQIDPEDSVMPSDPTSASNAWSSFLLPSSLGLDPSRGEDIFSNNSQPTIEESPLHPLDEEGGVIPMQLEDPFNAHLSAVPQLPELILPSATPPSLPSDLPIQPEVQQPHPTHKRKSRSRELSQAAQSDSSSGEFEAQTALPMHNNSLEQQQQQQNGSTIATTAAGGIGGAHPLSVSKPTKPPRKKLWKCNFPGCTEPPKTHYNCHSHVWDAHVRHQLSPDNPISTVVYKKLPDRGAVKTLCRQYMTELEDDSTTRKRK